MFSTQAEPNGAIDWREIGGEFATACAIADAIGRMKPEQLSAFMADAQNGGAAMIAIEMLSDQAQILFELAAWLARVERSIVDAVVAA